MRARGSQLRPARPPHSERCLARESLATGMAELIQESMDNGEQHLEELEEASLVVGLAAEAEAEAEVDRLAAPGCRPGLRAKISAR